MRVTRVFVTHILAAALIATTAATARAAAQDPEPDPDVIAESIAEAVAEAVAESVAEARAAVREAKVEVHTARAIARTTARYQGRDRVREASTETKTARVGANGLIELRNIGGDITITAGGGDTATIEITKTARGTDADDARAQLALVPVDVVERNGSVEVTTRYPDNNSRGGRRNLNVSAAYRVTAPAGSRVKVETISGDVVVTGVTGDLTLNTISGNVRVEKAGRSITAASISGNVDLVSAADDAVVELSSTSGNVTARSVRVRRLDLGSISGDVRGSDLQCDAATLHTMSGNVEYGGSLTRGGTYEFQTHSGDVRITLSGNTGFELEASTFSGEVRSGLDLKLDSTGRRNRTVRGTYGDGGARIEARSFSGTVIVNGK